MRLLLIAIAFLLAVGLAAPAAAQDSAGDEATLDGGTLPVSLDRVRRRMATLPADEDRLLLRLTARVNVYARAQAVEILRGFNVESWTSGLGGRTGGAIAHGSPTHNEMMTAATPEFWRNRGSSLGTIGVGW